MTIHDKGLSKSVYLRARGLEARYEQLPPHPLAKRYVASTMQRWHLAPMMAQVAKAVPVLAPQLEIERVFDDDPRSFWGFWRQGESSAILPSGLTALLLLSVTGVEQLLAGTLDFHSPAREALIRSGEAPSAIYIWLMYAPGRISGALFSLFEEMNKPPFAEADIYWRPVTAAGRRLTQPFGFELVGLQGRVPNLYRIARGTSAAVSERASSPSPAPLNSKRAQNITVSVARSLDEIMRAVAIRAAVFMVEQACPYAEEFDGNDFCATHVVASVDDEPAACIRLRFFGGFAKIERVAVRKEFRKSRAIFRLMEFTLSFCRRKGYATVYGHVQERLLDFWSRFGAKTVPGRPKFVFSDHVYVEMVIDLGRSEDAVRLGCEPHLLNRPEGDWDRPGILERSAERSGKRRPDRPDVELDQAHRLD